MNTKQIMALADEYSTYPGHPVMRKDLQAAIEALVQERDALKAQLEAANSGWYDKLLEATLERDKLAAENKVLRDALEACLDWMEYLEQSGDAGHWDWKEGGEYINGRKALQGANHEPS